ncbi:MAG: glycosyltransferase involved in cell wall biosynthesis [Bacteroidia bacterium]
MVSAGGTCYPAPVKRPRIIHVDAERGFSGGEVQVFHLMRGLRELGFEQHLVVPPGSRASEAGRKEGFDVIEVAMRNNMDLGAVLALRKTFRRLSDGNPAVVHLHTGRATWLGALGTAGLGLQVLSTRRMDRRVKRGLGTRFLYRKLLNRVVAISGPVRDCLLEAGVEAERIELIYSSVLPEEVTCEDRAATRTQMRSELDIPEQDFVCLVLARLHARKGIDVLLRAVEAVANEAGLEALRRRNLRASKSARKQSKTTIHSERIAPEQLLRVVIAGDGPERDALEEQARHLTTPDIVTFLGLRTDKAALLAMADVLVVPSHQEGLGVAALEAMGAGVAVIASRVGGLSEAVEEGRTGLLVEPGNVEGLAKAIWDLSMDRNLCRKLGASGPGRLGEGYLVPQMVAAYAELYEKLCGASPPQSE